MVGRSGCLRAGSCQCRARLPPQLQNLAHSRPATQHQHPSCAHHPASAHRHVSRQHTKKQEGRQAGRQAGRRTLCAHPTLGTNRGRFTEWRDGQRKTRTRNRRGAAPRRTLRSSHTRITLLRDARVFSSALPIMWRSARGSTCRGRYTTQAGGQRAAQRGRAGHARRTTTAGTSAGPHGAAARLPRLPARQAALPAPAAQPASTHLVELLSKLGTLLAAARWEAASEQGGRSSGVRGASTGTLRRRTNVHTCMSSTAARGRFGWWRSPRSNSNDKTTARTRFE